MAHFLVSGGRRMMWAAALVLGCCGATTAGTVIIHSNNTSPGDSVTQLGFLPGSLANSQALSGGWSYTNVYRGGQVGITTTFAGAGSNGSVYLKTNGATGSGTNNKADIEYRPGGNLGTLSELTSLAYDWYRASSNSTTQVPSLRILLSNQRYLVWEPIYNGFANAASSSSTAIPTGEWTTSDVLGGNFWYTGDIAHLGQANYRYNMTLEDWIAISAVNNLSIIGFSSGVGSSSGYSFEGAVDNITFGFNGASTTYNFEVRGLPTPAVPEPSSVAMGLIAGAAGLVMAARRRRAN
ncbi:PEP-CTERM sorting domain-containing protein [Paludisphaera sp.]|uniref:PEP-CTERM sorting domain-containing protein n=1 Tax=Paludisphaera sp. TaxID=2017432 RepID=UPI00301B6D29